ncbi:MAG: hypothetical protein V5A62_16995 [Haloarculaceae archaeon]
MTPNRGPVAVIEVVNRTGVLTDTVHRISDVSCVGVVELLFVLSEVEWIPRFDLGFDATALKELLVGELLESFADDGHPSSEFASGRYPGVLDEFVPNLGVCANRPVVLDRFRE